MTDDILTLDEAAQQLGLSPQTLRIQAKAGRLAARKVGPIWVTTTGAVERYRQVSLGRPGVRHGQLVAGAAADTQGQDQ